MINKFKQGNLMSKEPKDEPIIPTIAILAALGTVVTMLLADYLGVHLYVANFFGQ